MVVGASAVHAEASTLIVPDQVPSIQSALDAAVDTVLIRPGAYAEIPTVSQPVSLLAAPGDTVGLPVLDGMSIRVAPSDRTLFEFRGLRLNGPVLVVSDYGGCDIVFNACDLRAGVVENSLYMDTFSFTLAKCSLAGVAELRARLTCLVDSCQVTGEVFADYGGRLVVRGSTFQGNGTGTAVGTYGVSSGIVEGNAFCGYGRAIDLTSDDEARVYGNRIEDCGTGITVRHANIAIINNTIRRCVVGIETESQDMVLAVGNWVTGASGRAMMFRDEAEVVENVVWGCAGDGIWVRAGGAVRRNTSCFNGGSGFVAENYQYPYFGQDWVGNIACGNRGYGVLWLVERLGTIKCNDWFANQDGDVGGGPRSSEDFSVEPQFCDADSGDFHLNSASPLVDWPGCGLVGALGVGCDVTATLVQRFTAGWVSEGIRVVWEVAEGATASEMWLERSEPMEGQAWSRPVTERSMDGRAVVELDRSAISERAYWYRLVALEGSDVRVIGPPIPVGAQARPDFRLVEVGPNPGSGPVRIAFALTHAGAIEIDVFDVQGRRVAAPAQGVWPTGTHVVEWNGRTRNEETAPAGVYLLRYSYPGGQDRRRIVRVR